MPVDKLLTWFARVQRFADWVRWREWGTITPGKRTHIIRIPDQYAAHPRVVALKRRLAEIRSGVDPFTKPGFVNYWHTPAK